MLSREAWTWSRQRLLPKTNLQQLPVLHLDNFQEWLGEVMRTPGPHPASSVRPDWPLEGTALLGGPWNAREQSLLPRAS